MKTKPGMQNKPGKNQRNSGRLAEILVIGWKDLQVFFKDRGVLAVIFLLPLTFGSLLSTAYNSSVTKSLSGNEGFNLPVFLVNEDPGPYGKQVVEALDRLEMLAVETLPADGGRARADQGVIAGERPAAILIPADFSQKIDAYTGAELTLLVDPNQQSFAKLLNGLLNFAVSPAVLQGEIRYGLRTLMSEAGALKDATPEQLAGIEAQSLGVIMTQLGAQLEQPSISVKATGTAKNPDLPINFFSLIMPGFTVMFAFFLVGAMGASLFEDKDNGSFRRLLAAPVWRGSIIAGKMLAFGAVVVLQVILLFGVASGLFGMELGGSPLGLLLVTLALSLVVPAYGLMVASLARSGKQADNIGTLLGFILAGLGGCIQFGLTPLFLQQNTLGTIARLTPQGEALMAYYRIINEGAGVFDILPQVGIVLGMALLFFAIAVWRLRWD